MASWLKIDDFFNSLFEENVVVAFYSSLETKPIQNCN